MVLFIQSIQFVHVFRFNSVLFLKEPSKHFGAFLQKKAGDLCTRVLELVSHFSDFKEGSITYLCCFFPLSVVAFTTPAHALYFLGYEGGKKYLSPSKPIDQKGPIVHFTAGVIAEMMGALVWTPMVCERFKFFSSKMIFFSLMQ